MEKIRISNKDGLFGIISYNKNREIFHFEYAKECKGLPFGELNINKSRSFESSELFSLFAYSSGHNRDKLIEKYSLGDADSNEAQWFFLKLWAKNGEYVEGFKYELLS